MAVAVKNGLVGTSAQKPQTNQSNVISYGSSPEGYDDYQGAHSYQLAGNTSNQAYRGDLNTDFQDPFALGKNDVYQDFGNDSDADVRQARNLTNVLGLGVHGLDQGVDQVATNAQLQAVKARIGLKNSLGQAIGSNQQRESDAENVLRGDVNDSMAQGIKHTTQNFNDRGLLYSGMREGGVNGIKAQAASQLNSGLSDTKREYENLKSQQQQAYASIGMAQQQENIQRANQTFDVVNQNNIARQQATQQLAGGIGQLGGMATYYGSKMGSSTPKSSSPSYTYDNTQSSPPSGLLGEDNSQRYA